MICRRCMIFMMFVFAGTILGCRPATSTPAKSYKVPMPAALDQAKQFLKNYAQGQPITSEAVTFPDIVEEVRKTDPQKAKLLEEGFADMQKSPASLQAKAQALLKRL